MKCTADERSAECDDMLTRIRYMKCTFLYARNARGSIACFFNWTSRPSPAMPDLPSDLSGYGSGVVLRNLLVKEK
jgi:hypothetical protein